MIRTPGTASVALVLMVSVASSCTSTSDTVTRPSSTLSAAPGGTRVVVRGAATLDGAPFNSRWVGAVVLDHGLVTPCQTALPAVRAGRYSLSVYSGTESIGCGRRGARIALWIYANGTIVFSSNTIAWPGDGHSTTFAARYSTSSPAGAAPAVAQFSGSVIDASGTPRTVGVVEAYVGTTQCGVASVRSSAEFTGYVLSVVGPDARRGCERGAPLAFRVNGIEAIPTVAVVNTPPGRNEALNLRVP